MTTTTSNRHRAPIALAAFLIATACSPAIESVSATGDADFVAGVQALAGSNGLDLNGLNRNGLNSNGLNRNGLNSNGLNSNGLGTTDFGNWFNQNVASSDAVMKYLYACAGASGATLSWKNKKTGKTHSWKGALGLATGWTGGTPPTVAEQEVISACLAAHVNKYGMVVPIAVEGRTASGAQIPIGPTELADYSIREACFFGNVFNGDGVFGGPDHSAWDSKTSTARACVFDTQYKDSASQCPPIFQIGYCSSNCTKDATNTFYETCTYNGKTYKALTTRMRPAEQYKCGDGVCQFTESCGSGASYDHCEGDCGLCP